MRPLDVYTLLPYGATASFYYRLGLPLETAKDLGLPVRAVIDRNLADTPSQERIKNFCEADLILLYQPIGDSPIHNIQGLKSFIPSKRDGEWKWPPSVIIETDDNLFNVSPLNTAFRKLGIRDMEGNSIPPGHSIGVVKNGEKKVLWRDGHGGFSIQDNRHTIETYRRILEMADAVTCSTQRVANAVAKEVSPRRLRVFPNLMRMDHYEQADIREDTGVVKVLWQGGIAHYEDWFPLRQALGNITEKYPQVHWIVWGAQFPFVKELIPAHRYTYKPWCPYEEYKLRLVTIGHDISLAPLSANVFNDCRSSIKFMEASVLKKPAATLAQRTGPYLDDVIDGETGLLFGDPQEFEDNLSLLIEDATERKRLAANAKDWVSQNRDAMKEVPKLVEFWEQMREERKREQPHVNDEQWAEIEAEANAEQNGVPEPVPA